MSMKIAQVAPLYESVPPKTYGGTERVVSWLTEELVRQGHEVTLYAAGDSRTCARLRAGWPTGLRLDQACRLHVVPHMAMLDRVMAESACYDVVHFHIDALQFPLLRFIRAAHVTTMHGRLDLPELVPMFRVFNDIPLVSISNAQRRPIPFAAWAGTVYHGLPLDTYQLDAAGGGYLAFLGRIAPEKRVDRAIEIARRSGLPLKIAAKVDGADREYYEQQIKPLLDAAPHAEFVGEISDRDKQAFLGGALATLFPIDWPEPFGLVMIESMACGTPVIAYRHGSVPEVVDEGQTGFIVDTIDDAVRAVEQVTQIERGICRHRFEQRFVVEEMAHRYLRVYERVLRARAAERSRRSASARRRAASPAEADLPALGRQPRVGAYARPER